MSVLSLPIREVQAPALQHLRAYPVDAFLIDSSHGTGRLLDLEQATAFYKELREVTGLPGGVAGGFTPDNVQARVRMFRRMVGEDFSTDMETGACTGGQFNPRKAARYVRGARREFS